jgi:tetratricopeptide (TPR) repeat protein
MGTYRPLYLCAAFLFVVSGPGYGKGKTDLKTIEKYVQEGRHAKAIELLQEARDEAPKDPDVHYQLGLCYLHTAQFSQAQQSFAATETLDETYAERIAKAYVERGHKELDAGNTRKSQILFQKALERQPALRKEIAQEAFRQGKRFFDRGQYDIADEKFSVANSFDDSLAGEICDMYFQLGNSVDNMRCLALYSIASWYSNTHNEEIGLRLLQVARDSPSKEWQEKYKSEAVKYIGEEAVRSAFPEPSWRVAHASAYTGKGYDDANSPEYHIRTVRFGREILPGDRIVVETDGSFRIWDAGWQECNSPCVIVPENKTNGEYFYVEGMQGERITVRIQRYH